MSPAALAGSIAGIASLLDVRRRKDSRENAPLEQLEYEYEYGFDPRPTEFRVIRTSDDGATYTGQGLLDGKPFGGRLDGIDFADTNLGIGVASHRSAPGSGFTDTGDAYVTRDGGASWTSVSLPAGTGPLTRVEFAR